MAWGKAGSTTLSSGSDTITVSGMTASETNMILGHTLWSTYGGVRIVCDNDTGNNYAERRSVDGGSDGTVVNTSNIDFWADNTKYDCIHVGYFVNINAEEKLFIGFAGAQGATGAGTVPNRREVVGKYTGSSQVTRIDFDNENSGLGDILTDSNLTVLGSEMTPASAVTFPENVQAGSRAEITDTRKMYNAQDITGSDVSLTGLKAYYKFDESSGNLINQSTTGDGLGSNADGTASGDPTYSVTGKINKAISFDGDGDKFTLGTTAGQWNFLHNNTNFSVSFWLKLNATPSENQGILGTGTGGSSIGFDLTVNHSTGGKLRASIENGAGASANIQSSAGFVPQNTTTWYHYVLTFSNGSWNIYRNGGNNESASSSVSWSTSNHSRNMELANANANTPSDVKDLTGELDEVSIWSRVLTSNEITALYNSGAGKLISTTTQWQEIGA